MLYTPRNRHYRLHVSIDVLLIMLASCAFLSVNFLQPLILNNMNVVTYLLLMVIVFIRNMGFTFRGGIAKKLYPLWWLIAGVLLSFIPAYLYYGQHFYNSITVYRHFLGYFAFFLLLSIQPSRQELKVATYAFSVIFLIVTLYCSFLDPDFVYVDPEDNREFIQEGDFVHLLQGYHFLMLAFIFALDDLRNKKTTLKLLVVPLSIFGVILLTQSRTLLFSAVVVGVFSAMASRSARQRLTIGTLIIVVIAVSLFFAWKYVDLLITETVDQLNDSDYNRIKGLMYFFSGKNGTMSYFWGNGFISGKVHPIMEQLRQEGIYHSDLGLIGFWHQFGLIPVVTILVVCIKGLSSMRSFEVRANALNILMCAFTISYFRDFTYSLWLCLFWYMYSIDPAYDVRKRIHDAEIARRAMRRFRSLTK